MSNRITVDTGGTFTDVTVDVDGQLFAGKAATTPTRYSEGLLDALSMVAAEVQESTEELLSKTDILIYATTHATNAIIEGKAAKTALLITEGFPDVLVLRQAGKLHPYDIAARYPEPYVPKHLTFEVPERVTADGSIIRELDSERTRAALRQIASLEIEAIAVCLLWSIVNGEHERQVAALIDEVLPGVPFTLSHLLNPVVREYPRASATAIDASLKPAVQAHLSQISEDLRQSGFDGELLLCSSSGGVVHLVDAMEQPILLVRSGPSMMPVAGRHYAQVERLGNDVVVCDVGGTSFDVSLVRGGQIALTRETWLGEPFTGHLISMPTVDVRSVGAGGGSIASVDPGGLLKVGPRSAGAEPGPACYGRGGKAATVTDAALVLGYLPAEGFASGRLNLDLGAAKKAIDVVATALHQSREEAAQAILIMSTQHMVSAIQEMTVKEGFDPRQSVLVSGGGAAGLNIAKVAESLGCSTVLIPRLAGVLSANGAQLSNIVRDYSVTCYAESEAFPYYAVNEALETLEGRMDTFCKGLIARGITDFQLQFFVEARYPYQVWELPIPLSVRRFSDAGDVERLVQDFHEAHERVFAVRESGQAIECISWRGRVTGMVPRGPVARPAIPEQRKEARAVRRAVFEGLGTTDVSVYRGSDVQVGQTLEGPSIVEEPTTTIVIYPNVTASVSDEGNYVVRVG